MSQPSLSDFPAPPTGKSGWPWTEGISTFSNSSFEYQELPKVSIVTPSYNQAKFIEETIRSVLLQGYPNLEYIVIDGGSADGSVDIIRKYEPWLTYWTSESDRGQSHAINKGFLKSTGEILAWINSDDAYEQNALARVIDFFMKHPDVDVVYANTKVVDETGKPISQIFSVPFNHMGYLCGTVHLPCASAIFWRRSIFFKVGMLNENLHYMMDSDLFAKFSESRAKFSFFRSVIGVYRSHDGSKTFGSRHTERLKSELNQIPQLTRVRNHPLFPLIRLFYRLRQFVYLLLQGDLGYMGERFVAKLRNS